MEYTGLRGIDVAERADDFATAVVSLLQDSVNRAAHEAESLACARRYFDPDGAYGPFLTAVENFDDQRQYA